MRSYLIYTNRSVSLEAQPLKALLNDNPVHQRLSHTMLSFKTRQQINTEPKRDNPIPALAHGAERYAYLL